MEQDLQQLHEIELEILLEFRRICEKHNLTYYLVAGRAQCVIKGSFLGMMM